MACTTAGVLADFASVAGREAWGSLGVSGAAVFSGAIVSGAAGSVWEGAGEFNSGAAISEVVVVGELVSAAGMAAAGVALVSGAGTAGLTLASGAEAGGVAGAAGAVTSGAGAAGSVTSTDGADDEAADDEAGAAGPAGSPLQPLKPSNRPIVIQAHILMTRSPIP